MLTYKEKRQNLCTFKKHIKKTTMKYECKENDALIELGCNKDELLISIQGETAKTVIGLNDLHQALNIFGVSIMLPKGFKFYKCTDCQTVNVLKDNGEITVGFCSNCEHPLWND